jgi:hypothetical protein
MAMAQFREIDVLDAVDGHIGVIGKRLTEKYVHTIKCGRWIGNRGTLSGAPTATVSPNDANAPSVSVSAPVNQNFNITVSRGQVAWNTTGQGTITLVMTFSNGEKLELILDYKITRSAPMTTDFVARVQAALAVGWRNLGHLTGDVFHESDILYDPESKMYYAINTSADGNSGDPHIGWRRASTPEGIVSASGGNHVERALNVLYYPSFFKENQDWRVIGTAANNTSYFNKYTGSPPPAWVGGNSGRLGTTLGQSAVPLIDAAIRRNPADGYCYVVGLDNGQPLPYPMYLHRTLTPDTQNSWRRVGLNIFTGGLPSWATASVFDPNLVFIDGRAFLLFSGTDGVSPKSGMVEINPATALPIGSPIILNTSEAQYPWQTALLSDLNGVDCPDGIFRIFGFCNGPYDGSQDGAWGCLDLPPFVLQ